MKIAFVDLRKPGRGNRVWAKEVNESLNVNYLFWHIPDSIIEMSTFPVIITPKKIGDKIDVLNSYDFIIFTDFPTNRETSNLINCLEELKVPWTIMVHGNHYQRVKNLPKFFSYSTYCGKVLTTLSKFVELVNKKNDLSLSCIELPYLPYKLKCDEVNVVEGDLVVHTSLVSPTKGILPLALVAQNNQIKIVFRGITQNLPYGVTSGVLLNSLLVDYGFTSLDQHKLHYSGKWEAKKIGLVRYDGGFNSLLDAFKDASIHVNLTSITSCGQHLEYTTLEAIDYSILSIVPEDQFFPGDYPGILSVSEYMRSGKYNPHLLETTILKGLEIDLEEKKERLIELRNFISKRHDPNLYVEKMLKGLEIE